MKTKKGSFQLRLTSRMVLNTQRSDGDMVIKTTEIMFPDAPFCGRVPCLHALVPEVLITSYRVIS